MFRQQQKKRECSENKGQPIGCPFYIDTNRAKCPKRTKKGEIKYKKDRRGKKGLTKGKKGDKINKSPRERGRKRAKRKSEKFGRTREPKE